LLLAGLLAGCGGGSAGVQPGAVAPGGSGSGSTIESTIVVPAATVTPQSARRNPQYVSASSLGLTITVTDIPPTGGTASFTPTTAVYTLATGANKVVAPTPASAPGHSEDLTYIAYDTAPVGGSIPAGAKAVGWGLTTGFVVVPGQNTNNIVLSGVVDSFAPLAETGSLGMMSSAPPAPAGAQTSLGFGGATPASGIATLLDGGGNDITTASGGPWPVVGAVPTTATTVATGVPVTSLETAGTCGAVGTAPHLKLAFAGGTAGTSTAITSTNGALALQYDGGGGAGWYAVVTAKGQTKSLTYELASLGATSTNTDFSCTNQTLSFSYSNETATMTIVQKTGASPYTITVPNTASCTQLVTVYAGPTTAGAKIAYGTATSLGALTTFTVALMSSPPSAAQCNIEIQDANAVAGVTGGAAYPGATTYVAALLPPNSILINVP